MTTDTEAWARWRWSRRLLVALVVCRGLVYLGVLPLFEGWDEYQHVGYVVHVAETGRPAVLGETNVPRSLMDALGGYPQPSCVVDLQFERLGVVDYAGYWAGRRPNGRFPVEMGLYQAQHSWWYYRLAAPVFSALGGVADLRASVGGLRLLNLLFQAAATWVALGAIACLVRSPRDATWIGLVVACHPLFLRNGLRVANDALGVLLATVAVAGCLTLTTRRWPARCFAIGVATGLAVLAKAVNFALLPFVAFACLAFAMRDRPSPRRALVAGLVLALGFLAVTQGELRANLARYGALTPMQEAVLNRGRGRTAADLVRVASKFHWGKQVAQIWLRRTFLAGGWSNPTPPDPAALAAYSLALGAGWLGLGVAAARRRTGRPPVFRDPWTPPCCTVLCLSVTAALGYHMVQSRLAWGTATTGPWYASAAFPWFLALAVAGGLSWPLGRFRGAVPLVLAAAGLLAEGLAIWGPMRSLYSGGATGREALRRLASLQPHVLRTPTVLLAQAGVPVVLILLGAIWSRHRGRVGVIEGYRVDRSSRPNASASPRESSAVPPHLS